MTDSNWNLRFPRTSRCTGHAIEVYRTPLTKRFFYACIRHGWILFVAALAIVVLTGCSDMQAEEDSAADLRDAQARAYQIAKGEMP